MTAKTAVETFLSETKTAYYTSGEFAEVPADLDPDTIPEIEYTDNPEGAIWLNVGATGINVGIAATATFVAVNKNKKAKEAKALIK